MKMIWALCLLCLAGGLRAVHASPIRKTGMTEYKAAPQDEVNVLMFGVIQFSESLKDVYETTDAKIARVSRALKSHEGTLQYLGRETELAAEVEKQIKQVIQWLQNQMAREHAQTKMTKDWLASMEQEDVELNTKVKMLEMYINNSVPTNIKELQERAEELSDVLKGLRDLIKYQKENIVAQDEQLSRLQEMSEAMTESS